MCQTYHIFYLDGLLLFVFMAVPKLLEVRLFGLAAFTFSNISNRITQLLNNLDAVTTLEMSV